MAHWIGSRYFRKRDGIYVDRDDLDKKNKMKSVHRTARSPRAPFTKLEIRTVRRVPYKRR